MLKLVRGKYNKKENMINHVIKFMIIVKTNTLVLWLKVCKFVEWINPLSIEHDELTLII